MLHKYPTTFECKKIGIDIVEKTITRTTPIVISCNHFDNPLKEMRLTFSLNREIFMYD